MNFFTAEGAEAAELLGYRLSGKNHLRADNREPRASLVSMLMPNVGSQEVGMEQVNSSEQIATIRELFLEYAQSLGFSLCFQSFEGELAGLPGDYAPPEGRLLLATFSDMPAGCVALHKLDPATCEMKRLYVRPQFRGRGLGRLLAERIIAEARAIGYKQLRLDTVEPVMRAAVAMYRTLGFREIAPYRPNPLEGALYMELEL